MLFQALLKSVVHKGTLTLRTATGKTYVFGNGQSPHSSVTLRNRTLEWSLGWNPDLKIGEAYRNGSLIIEEGTLYDFLYILMLNYTETGDRSVFHWHEHLYPYLKWMKPMNTVIRSMWNVPFHYDMPDQLYTFFLDPDRQYSCAYFTQMNHSLERAQLDKKHHIASKLLLDTSGLRVLDIGSGWGGFGLYLAHNYACHVKGLTLSFNQQKVSQERSNKEGLGERCIFSLRDYRMEEGTYDRIVSVGMFEHVGKKNYKEFFTTVKHRLTPDGIGLLHTIGRMNERRPVNSFIQKYIFPGADIPTMSEISEAVENSGLYMTDVEILRVHYAETLKRWTERLDAHKQKIIKLYGEKLYRTWRFYFVGSEVAFRLGNLAVFQIQLSPSLEAVPLTRDYMFNNDLAHQQQIDNLDDYLNDIMLASDALRKKQG